MAERKSGPVKPPVIDLEARPAETAEPKPEAARTRPEPQPSQPRPTPRPAARLAMPWSAISIAALLGALLGTGFTYTLVRVLPLPDNRPQIADPAPALVEQAAQVDALSARLAALETETTGTAAEFKTAAASLATDLEATRAALAGLPTPQNVDLGPTDQRIGALETRIAALGAGASSPDAAALGTKVADLESRLVALETRPVVPAVPAPDVSTLRADIETLKQAVAARAPSLAEGEVSAAVRLPLLVAGLDSAFANGRPYADVLQSLKPLVPAIKVPDAIAAAAATGLPAPATVTERVSAAVPDMLGQRTVTASGDLVADSIDWFKGLIALRPSGDVTGNTPEALVARIESAAQRADWAGTSALFAQLPDPMRLAAGDVVADVARLAGAQDFIELLRRDALAPATETTP